MKFSIFLTALLFVVSCQTTTSSNVEIVSEEQINDNSSTETYNRVNSSIRKIDFQNFTFPWTKTFSELEKTFTLKNGFSNLTDDRKLSFASLLYIDVADNYDEQALVNVKIDDGNATYVMLYVFAIENNKPKLLESFEFGKDNVYFGIAFAAHDELIIETYHQLAADAECCPSIIEISYYKWQKDKFILQGEPQKLPNGYVERTKRKNEKN